MAINQQRLSKVQEFGLTEYEARTYLALLDFEVATASKVARLSRVPRTKIYQALEGLETKKLVRVIPERPKRYIASPFQDYLDHLENELHRKAADLKVNKASIAAEFQPKNCAVVEDPGQFVMVRGRSNVTEKVFGLIERARSTILVMGSEMAIKRFDYFTPALESARDRGVVSTFIGPVTDNNREAAAALQKCGPVRHFAGASQGHLLVIIDGKESLLVHAVPDDAHLFQGEDVALWTDDAAMVSAFATSAEVASSTSVPMPAIATPANGDGPKQAPSPPTGGN